ncbi:PepSY-associated TM helix domain-containing protein [Variovorax boronicumulans]|uniref:PepSY-associated TM helix domain-containing protein n=1 Tax=Variovorax boronicumulans TaxID=436515 RepID=UPI002781CD50|nr:PepSY-associated TM helix domain-containing protein [Variovorax boronicumulans]MDQ0043261.1 putative iron-regulated membrane protein [Variovorax boronicumulans]
MKEGFRQSMAWLHTWSGLLVGWVLFMVFAAGTASYFKDEITFWMKPELHAVSPNAAPQAKAAETAVAFLQQRGANAPRWFITLPTEREPSTSVLYLKPPPPAGAAPVERRRRFDQALLDPATGQAVTAPRETRGGEFFYRLHFDLHYMPAIWARWIVGFCAMFMLVAIFSGIVTHRRIFKDFFTFRPKKGQRSWLDAHNVTAVLALPYHAMITYTGLVTLMFMYMPWAPQAAYKDHGGTEAFFAEAFPGGGRTQFKASGTKAPLAPIAPMVAAASSHWNGAPVGRITVHFPNDANAVVSIARAGTQRLSSDQPSMQFNGVTGAQIGTFGDVPKAAAETRGVLYGLHIGRFADPLLRALFFLSGLAGCLMVATGLLLWAVKERQKFAKTLKQGGRIGWGLRLVDGLNLGAIAGLPMAMAAFFWANRLLPLDVADRSEAEIGWFFIVWGAAAVLGLLRPTLRMWQAQLALGALLFVLLPVLNAFTGPAPLTVSLRSGPSAVAGFDLVAIALGMGLAGAAWLVERKRRKAVSRQAASTQPPGLAASGQGS